MQVDFLIVGQGICGTMLSWFLHLEGKSFIVVDNKAENRASRIAAGVINPVTGRRYAYTWMIDEVMPFAVEAYRKLEKMLDTDLVSRKSIIDFFPSPQMRNAFVERIEENDTYLHSYPDQNHFNQYFHHDFGCGEISPSYLVNMKALLDGWRKWLKDHNLIFETQFDLIPEPGSKHIDFEGIQAGTIIYCDGIDGASHPLFRLLPFAPNKGEALIIHTTTLPNDHIFKKGLMLSPLPEAGQYWVGSNYQWEFEDDRPSQAFFDHASSVLKNWLKHPFEILQHLSAVRPATIERRPFVGLHPLDQRIGILNGMGTKGASVAPFFANQLVQHLVHGLPLAPEADIHRFNRVLMRS